MMKCIGLCHGKISGVTKNQNSFFIKFQSDSGHYDRINFEKDSQELQNLAEIIKKTVSPTNWVGTQVQLFLGPELSENKAVMVYGIAKGDKFFVPEYIFKIIGYTPSKKYYSYSEVAEILEHTEDVL